MTLAVQWGMTPRPVASGIAAEISAEDLPDMGEQHGVAITGMLANYPDAKLFRVDGVPGVSTVVMENSEGSTGAER